MRHARGTLKKRAAAVLGSLRRVVAKRHRPAQGADPHAGLPAAEGAEQTHAGSEARAMLGLPAETIIDIAAEGADVVVQSGRRGCLQRDPTADGIYLEHRSAHEAACDADLSRGGAQMQRSGGLKDEV